MASMLALGVLVGLSCKGSGEDNKADPEPARVSAVTPLADDASAAEDPSDPDLVATASPAYVAGPSVVTTATVDGAALRKRISARLRSDRSPVSVLQGEGPRQLGKALCEAVVPKVPQDYPVLLKPNIGGFAGIKNPKRHEGDNGVDGRITDPEFVRGVIHCLKERGHNAITVADSKNEDPEHWPKLMELSGYRAMAAEENVTLVAISDDGVFDVQGTQPGRPLAVTGMEKTSVPTLLMPKIIAEHLDHGLYISLPKIKTHRFSVVSLGIKGLQGSVMYSDKSPAYRQKWRSHRELGAYTKALKKKLPEDRALYVQALETFAERMVDVLEVQAPHVVLAEGAPAMSGDGFHTLIPHPESVAIGGTNTVLVDAVGAQFLGLFDSAALAAQLGGHTTSPLISLAAKRFGLDLAKIRIEGNGAALLKKKREPLRFISVAPFEISSESRETVGTLSTSNESGGQVAHVRRAGSTEIVVDGKADDAVWAEAKAISWDTNYAGVKTDIRTSVRFALKESVLYAFFELENTGLFTDQSLPTESERDGLYKEDCVELFLTPDPTKPRRYFEIEVGPFGHWLDIEVDGYRSKGKFNQAWSSGVRVATTRDSDARRATIEIAIPSADISTALLGGARLPMGLFRMEGKAPDRNYLAWSPAFTPKPKFHIPEAFGILALDSEPGPQP